jgi:hypothetical protein
MYFPSNRGYIGVGSQGAQKTTAATIAKFVKYTTEESGAEFEEEVLRQAGDGQFDVSSVKTIYRENISFSSYVTADWAAYLYSALLGSDTPSHLTTTPFYHTIVPKTHQNTTAVQKWLTVEKMLVGTTVSQVHRMTGCKFSSITISGEAGMPVTVEVEGTGITGALRTTASTPSYETVDPFSFYNGVYLINTPTTTNFDVKSFSIAMNAVNDEEIQTVAITRQDIINHRFNIEVTLGLNYVDYTMWKKANYGNTASPTSTYSDGSLDLKLATGSGTTEKRLQFDIPKLRLKPHIVSMNAEPNTLEQPLTGMAYKQATTDLVTVTCYTAIATTLPV